MRIQPTPGFKAFFAALTAWSTSFSDASLIEAKGFARCRIDAFEIVFLGGFSPFAVDEKTELVLVIFQPLFSIIRTFGSRTVFHFFVESPDSCITPSVDGMPPSNGRSQNVRVAVQYQSVNHWHQSGTTQARAILFQVLHSSEFAIPAPVSRCGIPPAGLKPTLCPVF